MTPTEWAILAVSIANLALALVVGVIYWRNHRQIRSSFTWTLVLFATLLVLHNAFQVYEFFAMMSFGLPTWLLLAEGFLQMATSVALLASASK